MRTTTRVSVESRTDLDCGGTVLLSIDVGELETTTGPERKLLRSVLALAGSSLDAVAGDAAIEAGSPEPDAEVPASVAEVDDWAERAADQLDGDLGPTPEPARRAARSRATKPAKAKPDAPKPARSTARPKAATAKAPTDLGVKLLRALHRLDGEVFDPAGGAATALCDAAGVTINGHARNVLAAMADTGHIARTVNGKRTTRITLTPKGLAVLDGLAGDEGEDAEPMPADEDSAPTDDAVNPSPADEDVAELATTGECGHCGRTFRTRASLAAHLTNAHAVPKAEARRLVAGMAA